MLDKLQLGYDVLCQHRPDLILISMAAFGKEGADSSFVGFGPVIEMMSGLMSLTGYGDGEPFKTGISYGDPVAGTFAVAAVGLGLTQRIQTGHGVHVDLSQRETAAVLIGDAFVESAAAAITVHRGNRDAIIAPQGCYRLPGDDRWLMLSVRSDDEWRSLCTLMNRSDLLMFSVAERHARQDELDSAIGQWLESRPADNAAELLQAAGIAAMPVLDTRDLLEDPHLGARQFWHQTPHPRMHAYRQQGIAWRFADAQPKPQRHSPLFGEHNGEILHDQLGLSHEFIAELAAQQVIADAPINPGVG